MRQAKNKTNLTDKTGKNCVEETKADKYTQTKWKIFVWNVLNFK